MEDNTGKRKLIFFNPGVQIRDLKEKLNAVTESPLMALKIGAVTSISRGNFDMAKEFMVQAQHRGGPDTFDNRLDLNAMSRSIPHFQDSIKCTILQPKGNLTSFERKNWANYYKMHAIKAYRKNLILRAFMLLEESVLISPESFDDIPFEIPKSLQICTSTLSNAKEQNDLGFLCDLVQSSQGEQCIYVIDLQQKIIVDDSYLLGFNQIDEKMRVYLLLAGLGCRHLLSRILKRDIPNQDMQSYCQRLVPIMKLFNHLDILSDLMTQADAQKILLNQTLTLDMKHIAIKLISLGKFIRAQHYIKHAITLDANIFDRSLFTRINRKVENYPSHQIDDVFIMPEFELIPGEAINWSIYYKKIALDALTHGKILRGILLLEESLRLFPDSLGDFDITIAEYFTFCRSYKSNQRILSLKPIDLIASDHGEQCLFMVDRRVTNNIDPKYLLGDHLTDSKNILYQVLGALGCELVLNAVLNKDIQDAQLENIGTQFVSLLVGFGRYDILKEMVTQRGVIIPNDIEILGLVDMRDHRMLEFLLDYITQINREFLRSVHPLTSACMVGHFPSVTLLLEKGANVRHIDNEGFTPLMASAISGNIDCLRHILKQLGPANNIQKYSWVSLIDIEDRGEIGIIKGDTFNDYDAYKAFYWAAKYGFLDILKELIEYGVSPETIEPDTGNTALHVLSEFWGCRQLRDMNQFNDSYRQPLETAKYLLERSPNLLNHLNNSGKSAADKLPIHHTEDTTHDLPVAIALLKLFIVQGSTLSNPQDVFTFLISRGCESQPIEALLKQGIDANLITSSHFNSDFCRLAEGYTPLMYCCEEGYFELAELLIGHQVDIDKTSPRGMTALMAAADAGRFTIVKLLIEAKANVHHYDRNGCSALIYASDEGHVDIVQLLVCHNASVNIPKTCNKYDYGPLFYAYSAYRHKKSGKQYLEVMKILLIHSANPNEEYDMFPSGYLLTEACERGYREIVELLIQYGADSNQHTKRRGQTPLMIASESTRMDILEFLLNNKADIHRADFEGCTALMCASRSNTVDALKFLLSKKANVNQVDQKGWTALMYAANTGSLEKIKLLINHGANVNMADNQGETALMKAFKWSKCVKYLIKHGADVNAVDLQGQSALRHALSYRCDFKGLLMLIQKGAVITDSDREILSRDFSFLQFQIEKLLKERKVNNPRPLPNLSFFSQGNDTSVPTSDGTPCLGWDN